VQQRARTIEEAGFAGIWIGDTVHRDTHISPDPLMWLLTAALATKRVELGVGVLQLPLRNPFELAQRLATMNALTQGRFTLGVGAGSTPADFEANRVERAVLANVRFDLSAPRRALTADGPFELMCGPQEAADRLHQVAELGFDDCLLAKPVGQTDEDVLHIRSIYPG
jgi:hypothetical protein